MSYAVQIKRLYSEAGDLHKQAKDKLKEYEGKSMPTDVSQQVDQMLDQVEAKTGEAKRLERAMAQDAALNEKANGLPAPGDTSRGNGSGEGEQGREAKTALGLFLQKGHNALSREQIDLLAKGGLAVNGPQIKALAADEDVAGGFTVMNQFRAELLQKEKERSAMRRISRVLPPIPGGTTVTPSQESELADVEWTSEVSEAAEDTVKPFGGRALTPHPLAKLIKVSKTLMRSSALDLEAWVRTEMAYKFAKAEENGFVNGNGARQPMGLKNTPSLPTLTTTTSLQIYGDDIINWIYKLPASYAPNARIICNRAFIRKIRTLDTKRSGVTADNYLWQPGLTTGQPNRLIDVPYEESDRMDDALDTSDAWEANGIPAIIGDFRYYWIVDSLAFELERLNELYARTNQVGFIGRKETDGQAVLAEAFYALKIKA